jgi:hypothetical protein
MNEVYLTQEPKVWLFGLCTYKQKNTACDLKKVRKSVYRQNAFMHVCMYVLKRFKKIFTRAFTKMFKKKSSTCFAYLTVANFL